MADVLDRLAAAAPGIELGSDRDLIAGRETDWTRRYSGRALGLARPRSTAEVALLIRACAAERVAVVTQGGNTGLVGASVPRGGELLLATDRLVEVGEPDTASLTVAAGAGTTLAALAGALAPHGLEPGLDFAARDSATLGGIAACDAGGIRALRHGTARVRIGGLEAVLGDGSVVSRMSGLLKDNAGYDLPALLIGSEGTLGVITRVLWRAVPRLGDRVAALVGVSSLDAAAELAAIARPLLPALSALEFFTQDGLGLVLGHLGRSSPLERPSPAYVLLELAGAPEPLDQLAEALAAAGIDDALIADEAGERERLWALREAHTEAIAAAGVPHKLDVGVPLAELGGFVAAAERIVAAGDPRARLIAFGHLGDGNVHVNLLGLEPGDESLDARILELAAELGGTISAEHGVGVAKAARLDLVRGPDEIAAMRRVKAALDPAGILNPGAVLAPDADPGRPPAGD